MPQPAPKRPEKRAEKRSDPWSELDAKRSAAKAATPALPAIDAPTASVPLPSSHDARPIEHADETKPAAPRLALAPANEKPAKSAKTVAREQIERPARAHVPPPKERDRNVHKTNDRKTAARRHAPDMTEVWTDEHGRRLSAREIRELKRQMHESGDRGSRRAYRRLPTIAAATPTPTSTRSGARPQACGS